MSNKQFMSGCALSAIDRLEFKEVIDERMTQARDKIRDVDKWQWQLIEKTYSGFSLKHFVENWHSYERIVHDKGCPTPFHEPYFYEMMIKRGNNTLTKFMPEKFE